MKNLFSIIAAIALVVLLTVSSSFAQEEMTMDEYNLQLAEWQKREAEAKAATAITEQEIAALKLEIAKVDEEINNEWQEIYALLGTDEQAVNEFRNNLQALEGQLAELAGLPPEELYKQREQLAAIEQQIAGYRESNIALLSEMEDLLAGLEGRVSEVRANMPQAVYDEYTVIRGDYLWKISGKDEIYNDPYQWMRIYTYNKDQIKDPDLIYPDQIFKIQREVGPNEYLVVKGDWLSKIASNPDVYNDPTKWIDIFEANKDFLQDKNLIYPYQVLTIPK